MRRAVQLTLGGKEPRELSGEVNPAATRLLERLEQFSGDELCRRQERLDQIGAEAGLHFGVGEREVRENNLTLRLDVIPRIIAPGEWAVLERGLIQRARAFEAFLSDLYSEQRILRERIIPYKTVLGDAAYLRVCKGLPVAGNRYIVFGGVDLVRTEEGQWLVSHNHFSAPTGISLVLQQRRALIQAFPELFEAFDVQPVFSFAAQLAETLASLTEVVSPHVVMLSRAATPDAFFEESFLARRMGVAVVRPGDLLVREGQVFLKTVTGLEKVDVIFRRVGSASVDPIAFGSRGFQGIPGLVNCIRKGTVAMANALGCGAADNKALLRYSDAIIRYYLKQEPVLRTVPTYDCGDPDQLEYVLNHLDHLVLKPVHRDRDTPRLINAFDREMHKLLKTNPAEVVAQPRILASLYPRIERGTLVNGSVYLRAFVLNGAQPYVLPGGLTRVSLHDGPQNQLADEALGSKDTWVLGARPRARELAQRPARLRPLSRAREVAISSRVAESLYWMGRYLERAENTARMIRILEEARWEELSAQTQAKVLPLWQGVAASTGKEELLDPEAWPGDTLPLSRMLLLGVGDPASVFSGLQAARANALGIREFITPEVFGALNRVCLRLEVAAKLRQPGHSQLVQVAGGTVDDIACVIGTALRTMPHDDGWSFFKIGSFLERAISTVSVLQVVLPVAAVASANTAEEDPDLTTLLRLLGSLDAYRREFRVRAQTIFVAELLWRNRETPSSVTFCCANLLTALGQILARSPDRHKVPVYQEVKSLLDHLAAFNTASMFPAINPEAEDFALRLPASLQTMRRRILRQGDILKRRLEKVHTLLDDQFFAHQTAFAANRQSGKELAA